MINKDYPELGTETWSRFDVYSTDNSIVWDGHFIFPKPITSVDPINIGLFPPPQEDDDEDDPDLEEPELV